ncbi:MAG TPA: class II aldolase/adducin family protein [Thermotogota bacterium]|nr:class II aldolase/adducin family protein [Thermotogota bacterium]HRW92512.1 class II aldolase/adducin family protein [Thermotogota bacterium]
MNEKEKLVLYSKLAWDRKLTESTGGNMSLRAGGKVLITPTTVIKHFLVPEDIVTLSLEGEKVSGLREPSSEYRMHLNIYGQCADAGAVFHAHPVHATALAVMQQPFPVNALPETALTLAPIAYLPYRMPGTDAFARVFSEGLQRGARVFVLQNHGVTVVGKSIEEAYARLETLEFLAQIALLSGATPGNHEIPTSQVVEFLEFVHGKKMEHYRPHEWVK